MPREIDERKKRKALRKLRRAALLAEQGLGPPLSDWETQFLEEVEARIETFGSAFGDPEKGGSDEPLSALQAFKLREIDKKARGKGKSGFKQRKPIAQKKRPFERQINEPEDEGVEPPPKPSKPRVVESIATPTPVSPPEQAERSKSRPKLRIIKGGADDS